MREHPPLKWMGNFKAVAIDYEFYLTLSDEPQMVCLTERQMYVLSVQNTYTYWLTRWYNTDDITQKTVQFIAAEIEGLLMCGCGVPVPTITDILNAQTYVNTTNTYYTDTYNTWVAGGETVASIAPSLDYSSGVPADIDKLLCFGLEMYLTVIVAQAKNIKQMSIEDSKDLTKQLAGVFAALGVAGGAAGATGVAGTALVAYFGGPWLLLGLALAAVGLGIASILTPMDLSVFTDPVAFDEVYCTMVNNMVGGTPTRASFQNALTPNEFVGGSNAAQLASVVQPYLDSLDGYLQFLVQMEGLYGVSNFTTLPDCGCVEPELCSNFLGSEAGWQPWLHPISGLPAATYTPEGWDTGYNPGFSVVTFESDVTTTRIVIKLAEKTPTTTNVLVQVSNIDFTDQYSDETDDKDEYDFDGIAIVGDLYVNVQTDAAWEADQRIIEICREVEP